MSGAGKIVYMGLQFTTTRPTDLQLFLISKAPFKYIDTYFRSYCTLAVDYAIREDFTHYTKRGRSLGCPGQRKENPHEYPALRAIANRTVNEANRLGPSSTNLDTTKLALVPRELSSLRSHDIPSHQFGTSCSIASRSILREDSIHF